MPVPITTGSTMIDGVPWAWEASGAGPAVCFFHGTLGSRAIWDSAVSELADRYRCVAVDWPGHGRSGFSPAGWTVEDLVRGVPLLLADAGVQRAVLVGLSQGGAISLRVALSRPDLVAGLVTVGAGPDGPAPEVAAGLERLGAELAAADEPGRRAKLAEIQDGYHAPGWARQAPRAAERELAVMSSLAPAAYPLLTRIPGQYGTVEDELPGIACPALVVWGAHDPRAFWGPRMVQLIPTARLAVIDNAGHHTPGDAPAEFNRALVDFLDRLTLPRGSVLEHGEPFEAAELGAPVPRPAQLFAIGLNYREHALEAATGIPERPMVFTKFPTAITGPVGTVELPPGDNDWEIELVAVIGRRADHLSPALAVDLALVGIDVTVLESRAEGERPHPGTNLTNIRSMEHMRHWGAADHLAAANPVGADIARDVKFVTRGDGHVLLNLPGAVGGTERLPFSSAAPRWGPQSSIEKGLRARLAEFPNGSIRWSATFDSYEELDDRVVVHYRDNGGEPRTISATYLVGADGSRSAVRRQTGIRMEGAARLAHFAAWYIRSPELLELMADSFGRVAFYWFANEDKTGVILMPQDSHGMFQFFDGPLPPDADGADWDYMKQRLFSAVGREIEVEIVEPTDFWVNSIVAPGFQSGRVLLAGEACHHVSVFGGFGMNLAIGDAAGLGWKLAGTLKGWAGPELLASYSAERVPVVRWIRDLTEESTSHTGGSWAVPGMEAPTGEGERLRAEIGQRIAVEKQKELVSLGARFGAAYLGSPVVVPDGTEPPQATFGEFIPSASPGARAPHLWLAEGRSLYDEVAHEGFTLLLPDPAASATGLAKAAASRGVPLRVVEVSHPDARAAYGAALALIRPDHHVAWRGADAPADPFAVIDTIRGAWRQQ